MPRLRLYVIGLTPEGDGYVANGKTVPLDRPEAAIRKVRYGDRSNTWQEQFQRNLRTSAAYWADVYATSERKAQYVVFVELHNGGLPLFVRADRILGIRTLCEDERNILPSRQALLVLMGDRDYFVDETPEQVLAALGSPEVVRAAEPAGPSAFPLSTPRS